MVLILILVGTAWAASAGVLLRQVAAGRRTIRSLELLLAVRDEIDAAPTPAAVEAVVARFSAERTGDSETVQRARASASQRIATLDSMAYNADAAATDALSGLLNRRALVERAAVITSTERVYSVAIADLDHFKSLNDTHGHDMGDLAIATFARALSQAVGMRDVVCRYGGEEFVVLLPNVTQGHAETAMQRARAYLRAELQELKMPNVTASFGVAESTMADDFDAVLKIADQALLRAKRNGRDQIVAATRPGRYGEVIRSAA